MTKSATEPFHCGVHTQPALHKPYRRRLDFHLTAQPRRLGSLRGQDGGNCVSSRICSASDLVRNRRAEIMASHWAAVESRKIQEKNRHFRKHRYDVGIVRAEARGPARSVLRTARPCEALPERRFTIGRSWAFGVGRGHAERWRNEKPVKLLKTNDLAKRSNFVGNDSNDLRPAVRNLSFRHAKDSIRFRGFWARRGPKRNRPRPFQSLRLRLEIVAGLKSRTAKSCANEVLRPSNPWRA
jgi:hypothetical protein